MEIAGARVLITHPIISRIMGSTVVALELAEYLLQHGVDVLVYAAYVADPAQRLFAERGIRTVGGDDPALALSDFDLVWVHSQVLPLSFLRELETPSSGPWPTFVFHHMSSLDTVADEFPWILGLEQALSSQSLFISPAALETNAEYFTQPPPLALFENPAPESFCQLDYQPAARPDRILVVSNHIPAELNEACDRLAARGVAVTRTGDGNAVYTLVTPELLSQFDLVITIGKTVQYCLVAGVPVFVYDHFGGPGYLNAENFESLAWRHFSARDSSPQAVDELVDSIRGGYAAAVAYQQEQRGAFIERFALDEVAPRVLAAVRPRERGRIEASTIKSYLAAQRFSSRFYLMWGWRNELQDRIGPLEEQLAAVAAERNRAVAEADELRASWSFRIGNLLIRPVALIRDAAARLGRRIR